MSIKTPAPARRQPRVVLARETIGRIEALAEGALNRDPELADRLLEELNRARVVAGDRLRGDVVAIGRPVRYRDEKSGQVRTVTLVFPEEADISEGRVSVMTAIGVALIGLAEGATFSWVTKEGARRSLTVLDVGEDG